MPDQTERPCKKGTQKRKTDGPCLNGNHHVNISTKDEWEENSQGGVRRKHQLETEYRKRIRGEHLMKMGTRHVQATTLFTILVDAKK